MHLRKSNHADYSHSKTSQIHTSILSPTSVSVCLHQPAKTCISNKISHYDYYPRIAHFSHQNKGNSWRPSVSGDNGVAPMVSLWWSCSAGCGCRDRSSSGRSCCSCCMRRRCRPRGMGWPLLSGACELSCLPTAPLFSALLS